MASRLNQQRARILTGAALAAAAAYLGPASSQADPFLTISLLGRLSGSGDPFSSTVSVFSVGQAIDYEIILDMAPVGTTNFYTISRKITSLTFNTSNNSGDGMSGLSIDVFQAATEEVQVNLTSQTTLNTNPTSQDNDNWDAFGSEKGTLAARSGGLGNDLLRILPTHQTALPSPAGTVRTGVDPEVVASGTFMVSAVTGASGLVSTRHASGPGASAAGKINGVSASMAITTSNQAAPDPMELYLPLTLLYGPPPPPPPPTDQWSVDASGNWSDAGNWSAGVPNAVDAAAGFLGAISAPRTVAVDAPQTVGTIVFDNANSYTIAGPAAITLDVGSGSAAINVNNGSHEISAPLILADSAVVTIAPGRTLTISEAISGGGGLSKNGLGILVLAGTNSYSGGTTVNLGILQGDTASLQGNITDDGALIFSQVFDGSYAGAISGPGSVAKSGGGTVVFAAANSYSGSTTLSAGTLRTSAPASFSPASAMTVNSGTTLDLNGFSQSIASLAGAGLVTLGTGTLTAGSGNASTTFSGAITGLGAVEKLGTGTWTLLGTNLYTGGTTISAGTLQGNTTSLQGDISLGSSLTFNQSVNGTYGGNITGTGHVTRTGSGTVVFSGTNSYSGGTSITSGTLQGTTASVQGNIVNNGALVFNQNVIGSIAGLISGTGSVTLSGSATIALGATNRFSSSAPLTINSGITANLNDFNQSVGSLAGGGAVTLGSATLTAGSSNTSTTFSGPITGAGAVTKTGSGTWTLLGSNTYSGGTTITAGTLQGNTASLQGNIADGAFVIFNQTFNGTYAGAITGTGSVTKAGSGIITFTGANIYSGSTSITFNGGRLRAGAANTFSNSSAFSLAAESTTLDLNGFDQSVGSLSGSSQSAVVLGSATLTSGLNNTSTTYSGIISGSGALTKAGSGTWTILGSNTYSGGTTILAGALQGNTTSLQGNIADGTSLIFNQTLSGTYAGIISGTGKVTRSGTGTVTFTGSNSYSGGTTITTGILQGNTTSLQGDIADGSSLIFNQSFNGSYAGIITGTGSVTKTGTGIVTFTGANTQSGSTTVSAGTLRAGMINTFSPASTLSVTAAATADLNSLNQSIGQLSGAGSVMLGSATLTAGGNNTSTTHSGIISGAGGALTKIGSGALTLAGNDTYTGATTVKAGRLIITGSTASSNFIAMGGSLALNGTINADVDVSSGSLVTASGVINGSVNVGDGGKFSPGNSPGTVTTYSATWAPGGSYLFEIRDAAGSPGIGTDFWYVNNVLNITASAEAGNRFIIDVDTLNATGAAGLADNFDPSAPYQWDLVHADGGMDFEPQDFVVDAGGFLNGTAGGQFSIERQGNDLFLRFQPGGFAVPEPAAISLMALAALGLLRNRRYASGTNRLS